MPPPHDLWREDPAPAAYRDCQLCSLSQQGSRVIWGEGNPDGKIFALLDNPGAREDKEGKPFVCGTRRALYGAIAQAGLDEKDVYITFLLRCRPLRKYNKDRARTSCLNYLKQQLASKKPLMLVCHGNVVAQAYLQDPQAEIKNLRGQIITHQGLSTAFAYHPLAIRRRPNLGPLLEADWQLVADYYKKRAALLD